MSKKRKFHIFLSDFCRSEGKFISKTRASVLHKARISVDNCGDVYRWCDCGKEGEIVTSAARECVFDVFVLAFKEKHMRTVVIK